MWTDWPYEASLAGRAIVASLLGGAIGWQRERSGHEAGVRTCATVALGSCVFGLVSQHLVKGGDPTRIAAQVVTGIGFLGAGVILRDRGKVKGLTTAATIWPWPPSGWPSPSRCTCWRHWPAPSSLDSWRCGRCRAMRI